MSFAEDAPVLALIGVANHFQIITNVFVQTVVLLYLIDNNENTSWMILMGSGMGVVVEAWKVHEEPGGKVELG